MDHPKIPLSARLRITLRDWWRGFTNEDLASALRKTESNNNPGEIVWLSDAEYKAWIAFTRRQHIHPVAVH